MSQDIIEIIINGLKTVKSFSVLHFTLGFALAMILAAITWVGAVRSAMLWNKAYHKKPVSHVFGFFAACFTFFYVIIFMSFGRLDSITQLYLDVWSKSLKINQPWQESTFQKAFYAAKKTDPDGFVNVTPPENGGDYIPVRNDKTRVEVAYVYANQANQNFKATHPFLSCILFGNDIHTTKKEISSDIHAHFNKEYTSRNEDDIKTEIGNLMDKYAVNVDLTWLEELYQVKGNKNPSQYQAAWAVELASENIRNQLEKRVKRVKFLARTGLTLLFLLLQLIPFGIIGFLAYRNLKI